MDDAQGRTPVPHLWSWGAAYVLALAAWHRDDVHDAMRWLGGDITLCHHTTLAPGLRSGDLDVAGGVGRRRCRLARACPAGTEVLERERPGVPLFTGVAGYARGILERDARCTAGCRGAASRVVAAASLRRGCRGRRR